MAGKKTTRIGDSEEYMRSVLKNDAVANRIRIIVNDTITARNCQKEPVVVYSNRWNFSIS